MAQYQSFPDAVGDSLTFDKLKALRLPALAGKSFLDVGCNEGFFCGFARFQGASRVVGIDHSAGFIKRARGRFPDCEFLHRGWDDLPSESFDVILLASALHYAEDQPALISALVDRLSPDGTLVLELGVISSRKAEWKQVKRGIDERLFPSMKMLQEVLAGYAWKWMGPSVSQQGDPVSRHVVHISRRRPLAYLLMQPPGYGKSTIAASLFPGAGVPVVSGDHQLGLVAGGKIEAAASIREEILESYSPFHLDKVIQRIFDRGLGADLVALWLSGAGGGDVALDVYVPTDYQETVERVLEAKGYLPVRLHWNRVGLAPMPEQVVAEQAKAFYMSMLDTQPGAGDGSGRPEVVAPAGFVDEISVDAGNLIVRGWAVDETGSLPKRIAVRSRRRTIQVDVLDAQLRPDVQQHLGLAHALVGFRISLDLPNVRSPADLDSGFKVFIPGGMTLGMAGDIGEIFRCERAGASGYGKE